LFGKKIQKGILFFLNAQFSHVKIGENAWEKSLAKNRKNDKRSGPFT
jgi:hypothetical protein